MLANRSQMRLRKPRPITRTHIKNVTHEYHRANNVVAWIYL
jgi:hypothetical protein